MTKPISATWTRLISSPELQRSSHTVSAVDNTVYVFGGELQPREPRDNDVHKVTLGGNPVKDSQSLSVSTIPNNTETSPSPSPRVGTATTTLHDKIYLFSGRGGPSMAAIEESGALWTLDTTASSWSLLQPSLPSSPSEEGYPSARSYHTLTSDPTASTIYLHAGCPASGRLGDLWCFSLSDNKSWKKLRDAPGPSRGGTSIAYTSGKIYRMNGFDGKEEIGGSLDVYDIASDTWETREFVADGTRGPGARSVAGLVGVEIPGQGSCLVTLFGESDPSAEGHLGAGKMLEDVWVYGIEDGEWAKVEAKEKPRGRGWFDAEVVKVDGRDAVVVVGGLGEGNERLDDLWVLTF